MRGPDASAVFMGAAIQAFRLRSPSLMVFLDNTLMFLMGPTCLVRERLSPGRSAGTLPRGGWPGVARGAAGRARRIQVELRYPPGCGTTGAITGG